MVESKIYLIRHGDTEATEQRLVYGGRDYPLSELGYSQIRKFKEAGQYPEIDQDTLLYCTPLIRSQQTLQEIYGNVDFEIVEELSELRFGEFECTRYDEMKDNEKFDLWFNMKDTSLVPDPHPVYGLPGESYDTFLARTAEGFRQVLEAHQLKALSLRHQKKPALSVVVCHGGVLSAIMARLCPEEHRQMFQWFPTPGGMYVLTYADGVFKGYERVDEPDRRFFR